MSSCESSLHQGLRALHQLLRLLAVLNPTEEVCREVRVGGSRNHGHPGIGHAVPCRCDHRAVPHHYVCKGKCQAKEMLKDLEARSWRDHKVEDLNSLRGGRGPKLDEEVAHPNSMEPMESNMAKARAALTARL